MQRHLIASTCAEFYIAEQRNVLEAEHVEDADIVYMEKRSAI
jgi:hypothetical protein